LTPSVGSALRCQQPKDNQTGCVQEQQQHRVVTACMWMPSRIEQVGGIPIDDRLFRITLRSMEATSYDPGHYWGNSMDRWLSSALDYIPRWLDFQMQASQQPGCIVAIAHRNRIVLERAWGSANLDTGEELTPRHRFRIASHTKSFTAAAILKLREQ